LKNTRSTAAATGSDEALALGDGVGAADGAADVVVSDDVLAAGSAVEFLFRPFATPPIARTPTIAAVTMNQVRFHNGLGVAAGC
jgi:hypothetical protein